MITTCNVYLYILKIKYVRFYREPPSLIQKCNSPPLVYNCGAGPERIRQGGGGGGGEGGSGVEEEVKRARLFASSGVQAKRGKVDMDGLAK